MALTTVSVHIEIREPVTNTPAVGTVVFNTLIELRDVVDNIVYAPMTFTATLVAGEATIVLPATDNPDLLPASWVYQVWINTDILNEVQYVQIPFAPGTTEFADLTPLDYDPCTGVLNPTPLAPGSENLFVLKTGDTMTGNLLINASLGVTGLGTFGVSVNTPLVTATNVNTTDATVGGTLTAEYQGVSGDVVRLLSTALSSGVASGGEFTINANPMLLDISAMSGWIVDYNSSAPISATNPMITFVTLPAQIGLALTGPPAQTTTWWLVDSAGTIIQQAANPTPAQRRTHIVLGATAQFGGVIFVDQTLPVIQSQPANQLADLMDALGPFSKSGNVLSANGVNLSIDKTAGTMFARAFSQVPTYLDPHNAALAAQTPVSARRATATAVLPTLETLIDVANYDPGGLGVVTPVGGGANTSTNFRVWGFASNAATDQIAVQYGQSTYASLSAATQGIGSGSFIPNPLFVDGALLGWISVIRTATDLSNPTQAVFTKAPKFATP